MSASAALMGSALALVPEQHSDRLQAGELCFARLIGLLLGPYGVNGKGRPVPARRAA
jgi:hypothetical protein